MNPASASRPLPRPPVQDGGTRQLLQWGGSIVATGLVALVLLLTALGGFTPTGATTNAGWFALIVVLMSLPFGSLLLALGVARWLRSRALARRIG